MGRLHSLLYASLGLCLMASLGAFQVVNAKADLTHINYDFYHSSGDLMKEIKNLVHRHPDKLNLETVTSRNKGYEAKVVVVTYGWRREEHNDRSKHRILLSFGQHGRELITSELALRILSVLSGEHILQNMDSDFLNSTVNKLIIKVVPMENMNGRELVESGDLCERRNGRGVDLNRNWSVDWGKKEEDFDPYEENPGSAPFSEPETQIMRKLALSFDPHIWVNVHSGMEALFMPYDHKNKTPDGVSSEQMKLMLEKVNLLHFHQHCMIGSGGGSVGYLAHGTATDFMYDIVKVPMAFTFEIYGDKAASTKDCFKMFNPTNFGTYNQVMSDWSAAFFTIFNLGTQQLAELPHKASASELVKWVSIDEYLDGYLMERTSRYGKKKEVFELGMQEIRTYFRLFLLSSILLMIMFYTRISKRKCSRPIVSTIRLTSHIVV